MAEDISVSAEGDMYATESSPAFRPISLSGAVLASLSVPGTASSAAPKCVEKHATLVKSARTTGKLASEEGKTKLTVPLTSSSAAMAAPSSQCKSPLSGQPSESRRLRSSESPTLCLGNVDAVGTRDVPTDCDDFAGEASS